MSIIVKQISSLEKIIHSEIGKINTINKKTIMKGESFSYQIAIQSSNNTEVYAEVISPLEKHINLYSVKNAVMDFPVYTDEDDKVLIPDDDFITKKPGLMPDILMPIEYEKNMVRISNEACAFWVRVKIPEDIECG